MPGGINTECSTASIILQSQKENVETRKKKRLMIDKGFPVR